MRSKEFWLAALERAVKTIAQALLSIWLVGDVAFNFYTINWGEAFGVAAGAALISLLTSIVSTNVGEKGTPSLTSAETLDSEKYAQAVTVVEVAVPPIDPEAIPPGKQPL